MKSPHFRGYTRIGGERTQGLVDWREQIDIGPERPAVTDPDACRDAEARYAQRYRQPRENPARVVIEISVDRILGQT